jgi:tRNA-uridine 2-sulfurtransferase
MLQNNSQTKVVIGMSGGVDSAVAALLLKEQGYNVTALFMKNWEEDDNSDTTATATAATAAICSAARDFNDAQAVCDRLQIPLHAVNFSQQYWQRVFQHMLDEYAQGRTPNPDILCNQEIKFKEFLNYALNTFHASFIATGHYARHIIAADGTHKLYKAADQNKDQTYFLYTLGQKQLAATIFPLGEITKQDIRAIAKKAGLPNCTKKDSTGICFIGERKFKKFLSEYLLAKPGEIVSADDGGNGNDNSNGTNDGSSSGNSNGHGHSNSDDNNNGVVLGKHDGLMFYTLGQRQGLGIGGKKGAAEAPWYVAQKDLINNRLIVTQDPYHPLLMAHNLVYAQAHWIAGHAPLPQQFPMHCTAKIRYRQTEQACTITANQVTFDAAQRAITPGQSVVFYSDDECLGGGIIQ